MGQKTFFRYLLIIFILLSLLSSTEGEEDDLFSKIGVLQINGKKNAPNFRLEDLKGRKIKLKNFRGKVIFLNFWATWCGPCKEELPSVETLY